MASRRTSRRSRGRKEYGIENEAGGWLIEPSVMTKKAARVAAARLAGRRGESVYVIEVNEDSDGGSRIVVDREEIRAIAEPPRSKAQLEREIRAMAAREFDVEPRGISPHLFRRAKWNLYDDAGRLVGDVFANSAEEALRLAGGPGVVSARLPRIGGR